MLGTMKTIPTEQTGRGRLCGNPGLSPMRLEFVSRRLHDVVMLSTPKEVELLEFNCSTMCGKMVQAQKRIEIF